MTALQPGDVVADNRSHLWFVHGAPALGLHLTGQNGTCALVVDIERLFGPLTLHCRPSTHVPAEPISGTTRPYTP